MTTTKTQLKEQIERWIEDQAILELGDHCYPFTRGAHLLLPALLELVESLQWYVDEAYVKNPRHSDEENEYLSGTKANEALSNLEKRIEASNVQEK